MKKLILTALFGYSASFAADTHVIRDCAETNIPTTFTGAGAISLTNIKTRGFVAYNDSLFDMRICFTNAAASGCVEADSFPMPAGSTVTQELFPMADKVYVHSVGAPCTAGEYFIWAGISQ